MTHGSDWDDDYGSCPFCDHCQKAEKEANKKLNRVGKIVEEFHKEFPEIRVGSYSSEGRMDFSPLHKDTNEYLGDDYVNKLPEEYKGIKVYLRIAAPRTGYHPIKPKDYVAKRKEYKEEYERIKKTGIN